MNEKGIGELRRRFRPDKTSVTHIRGCYVNEKGEIVSEFTQALSLMTEDEAEKMLALLRKALSGSLGKNLVDLSFTTAQPGAPAPDGPSGRGGGGHPQLLREGGRLVTYGKQLPDSLGTGRL